MNTYARNEEVIIYITNHYCRNFMVRVLITGTTGFIGGHLRDLLLEKGYEVYSLERYVAGRIGKVDPYIKDVYFADLRDIFAITKAINDIKPDIVIHLAAMTAVAYSYAHPQETIETNFLGTVNLAEVCTKCSSIKQFIFASSAEVYGISPEKIKKETDNNLIPNTPYAVSKYAAETYLNYLYKAYNFPITIFRPFNSYGRLNDTWFVVEKTIIQMLKQDICKLGDPNPIRDFVYLKDQLDAYTFAIENEKTIGETFNIATGRGVSIKELADLIAKKTNFSGKIEWDTMPARPLDILHLIGSNEKILNTLKIPEFTSLEKGLDLTIKFWREKLDD